MSSLNSSSGLAALVKELNLELVHIVDAKHELLAPFMGPKAAEQNVDNVTTTVSTSDSVMPPTAIVKLQELVQLIDASDVQGSTKKLFEFFKKIREQLDARVGDHAVKKGAYVFKGDYSAWPTMTRCMELKGMIADSDEFVRIVKKFESISPQQYITIQPFMMALKWEVRVYFFRMDSKFIQRMMMCKMNIADWQGGLQTLTSTHMVHTYSCEHTCVLGACRALSDHSMRRSLHRSRLTASPRLVDRDLPRCNARLSRGRCRLRGAVMVMIVRDASARF